MTQENKLKHINNYLDCIAKYSSSIMYDGYFMNIKKIKTTRTSSIEELHPIIENFFNQYFSEHYSYGIALEYKNRPTKEITTKEIPFVPIEINNLLDISNFNYNLFNQKGYEIFSEPKLSQWFINYDGKLHKDALNTFIDLLLSFINNRDYTLYKLQDNSSKLTMYEMDLKRTYILILQIKESDNYFNNYMLHCCIRT